VIDGRASAFLLARSATAVERRDAIVQRTTVRVKREQDRRCDLRQIVWQIVHSTRSNQ
jgi:hypothetical protein